MLQSKLFYKANKNKPMDIGSVSHDLLVRAGYVDQLMAGVYSFLPLGFKVLKNIEGIIRKHMELIDGQELLLPVLQPKENWVKTDRINIEKEIIFLLKGNGDKEYVLGPTHEEVVTPLAKKIIFSYRDLPLYVFQIQDKLRDELRPKSGLLRVREFMMKDLYSFHANQADLDEYYEIAAKAYEKIFKECGIGKTTYRTLASGGSFSKYSDEFQTVTNAGEDLVYVCKGCGIGINKEIKNENPTCPKCKSPDFEEKKAVEVGNIFKMGTRFSSPFELKFTDRDGHDKPVLMGCYGIGLGRLMGAIVEASHDDKGIIWPKSVTPFHAHLIALGDSQSFKKGQELYEELKASGIEVLFDDRSDVSAGEKFSDADLIGIPWRIVISKKTADKIEIKKRSEKSAKLVSIPEGIKIIKKDYNV